jgi:hypothetical protein
LAAGEDDVEQRFDKVAPSKGTKKIGSTEALTTGTSSVIPKKAGIQN